MIRIIGDRAITSRLSSNTVKIENPIQDLDAEYIIFKPMDFQTMTTALNRLLRFRYPNQDRNRVFREILTKHTVQPKISLKNFNSYPLSTINALVKLIWDKSLQNISTLKLDAPNYLINLYLCYEESLHFKPEKMLEDVFKNENLLINKPGITIPAEISTYKEILKESKFEYKLPYPLSSTDSAFSAYSIYELSYPLDLDNYLKILTDSYSNFVERNKQLKRLLWINQSINSFTKTKITTDTLLNEIKKKAETYRSEYDFTFPAQTLIIVEGITEEKLLPIFMQNSGIDFHKEGIHLISAGGKNQSLKLYDYYSEVLNIPILVILDADAQEQAREISSRLRKEDNIYLIENGEFEDILTEHLICRTINNMFGITEEISAHELRTEESMVTNLEHIWKEKGLGQFNKSEFAEAVAENIKNQSDVSCYLSEIAEIIKKML